MASGGGRIGEAAGWFGAAEAMAGGTSKAARIAGASLFMRAHVPDGERGVELPCMTLARRDPVDSGVGHQNGPDETACRGLGPSPCGCGNVARESQARVLLGRCPPEHTKHKPA